MRRLILTKLIACFFAGVGLAAIFFRFWKGLGPTTNLSDYMPWGYYKGAFVMGGVALAAGGFVMAAAVYVFRLEKYHPLLRGTILASFLGYTLVPIGLMLDLGLPWNIWHPILYWQHNSFLFEISICVMSYVTVLSIEFFPVALEHPLFDKPLFRNIYRFLKKRILIFVIAGIMLSTLHQSSLGGLFLIIPLRTHPLWFSPIIPLLYFISAIGLGLSVIIFGSTFIAWVYKRPPKIELLVSLGKASSAVLLLYLVIRTADLIYHGKLSMAFNGEWQSNLFLAEVSLSVILPLVLFNLPFIQRRITGLFLTSLFVIGGIVLNRLNISVITFYKPEGIHYFPSLIEIASSLGLLSIACLIFLFCVEHLDLFEGEIYYEPARDRRVPLFSRSGSAGPFALVDHFSILSTAFVFSLALGLALFYVVTPEGRYLRGNPAGKALAGNDAETFRINNGDTAEYVDFNHKFHQDTLGRKESCTQCHHMNLAGESLTPCYLCHQDMYAASNIFNHPSHERHFLGKGSCGACHPHERTAATFRPCADCHKEMFPDKLGRRPLDNIAPAYMDAMHTQCIGCHEKKWKKSGRPGPEQCGACHESHRGMLWLEKYTRAPVDFG